MILLVIVSARSVFCSDETESAEKHVSEFVKRKYAKLKMESDSLISKELDDSSLQSLIHLFGIELKIVKSLLINKTGIEVNELLVKRDRLVHIATKTVAFMYKTVMNFATSDVLFDARRGKRRKSPLCGRQKKEYLDGIKTVLSDYQGKFLEKQHYLSCQTLCLPPERYNVYLARNEASKKNDLLTHVDVVDFIPDIPDLEKKKEEDIVRQPEYLVDSFVKASALQEDKLVEASEVPVEVLLKNTELQVNDAFEPVVSRSQQINLPRTDLVSFQSELRNELDDDVRNFGARFMMLRDNFIEKMRGHEVVSMIDSVVYLIKDEIENHVSSKQQREKMFHGNSSRFSDIRTEIDVVSSNSNVSRKARVLFGALTDTATKKTMELGGWNPDIYELNLRHYLSRIEYFKSDMERMLSQFKNNLKEQFFTDCKCFQTSLNNLMSNLVYSISSVK